jgi:hypothetical protein
MDKLVQDECLSMEELIGDLIEKGYQVRFWANGHMDHVEIMKDGKGHATEQENKPLSLRVRSLVPDYRDESRYWLLRKLWLYVLYKDG